ncbi:MAG: redox-sensing transcriptional repressor Rex [Clostridia bacterium]|nr:redox-sensing transcriptional repressor Rex [Clostridia bacterium]
MSGKKISKATIARLPLYLNTLRETHAKGEKYVSSSALAQSVLVSAVLVRKDLSLFTSVSGKPRKGFEVQRLIGDIEKFLGYDNLSDAVVVGAGGLGKAFLGYEGFKNNGLNILAAFDVAKETVGLTIAGKSVYHISELERYIKENNVRIGIVAVPKTEAQRVVDLMVGAGVKALWNFAAVALKTPAEVVVKNEDLSASLAYLASELIRRGV